MLGRMNTAHQAQRRVAVGSMRDMTALMDVALPLARRSAVVRFLAAELGVEVPVAAEGGVSDEPRDDKRVSNATLRALGFTLRHPTYRDGFAALLRDEAPGTERA